MSKERILAIGAHSDDMEQFVGGTLIHFVKRGHKVTIAPLTDGRCGTDELTPDKIIAVRAKEQEKAAGIIGAKYINLGIKDGCVSVDLETVKKVVALIRDVNPQVIFTHPTVDYMSDHYNTGQLVIWAVPEAGHINFEAPSKKPAIEHNPHLYHTDPQGLVSLDGQFTRVNRVVDITETIDQKLEAFGAHVSQIDFLPNVTNAIDKTRRWAVIRGEQIGVAYAEGFCQNLLAQYPKDNILFKLLPGKVIDL